MRVCMCALRISQIQLVSDIYSSIAKLVQDYLCTGWKEKFARGSIENIDEFYTFDLMEVRVKNVLQA